MESKQVQILLDKFFEGQTTLKEEQMLKAYFQQDEIDETFMPYQGYFVHIESAQAVSITKHTRLRRKPAAFGWAKRVAAVAAVGMLVFWLSPPIFDAPTEEELAYATFKENMFFMAGQLNKAEQDIAYINHLYDKPKAYLKYD